MGCIFALPQRKTVCKKFYEPETDEIMSRFWCGGRRKAFRLSRTTSRKMPEFHCFGRVRIAPVTLCNNENAIAEIIKMLDREI